MTVTPWWQLDVPKPPSVNRFKAKLGNHTPAVKQWIEQADRYLVLQRPWPRLKCDYELALTWSLADFGRFDIDNRVKAACDWLQRVEIIQNDRYCRRLTLDWGHAPRGCRIRVRPWVEGDSGS